MALELVLRRHEPTTPNKGVTLANTLIQVLGCADDLVTLEEGSEEGADKLEVRVNDISEGSHEDVDMDINKEKTVVLWVQRQDKVTKTSEKETVKVCKFACPHSGCGFKFKSKSDMRVHVNT